MHDIDRGYTNHEVSIRNALAALRGDTRRILTKILDGIIDDHLDVPDAQTALDVFTELVRVCRVQEEVGTVNEGDLLVLRSESVRTRLQYARPRPTEYSSLTSPASSACAHVSRQSRD